MKQEATIAAPAHTPGPWKTRRWTGKEADIEAVVDGKPFLVTGHALTADACLISAAPDLLEPAPLAADLLEHYAAFIRSGAVPANDLERHPYLPHIEEVAASLRGAVAKATGAQS
jgi:hypothetical protein